MIGPILGLAVVLLATAGPGEAANMLINPSFEQADDGQVHGWERHAWHGQEAARWLVDTPGHGGDRCLSIRSDQGSDVAWSTTVTVQPHTFYRLSGWIRCEKLRGAVGALFNIQNMQHVRTARVTGSSDWQRVATVFRTEEQTALDINCLFGGWGDSTGQAWYDDVALEPLAVDVGQVDALCTVETTAPRQPYSRFLRGGFIEHFDRQIYGGIYEPGSPLADEQGFRRDVIAALRELKLAIVRWPGGCFASGYHWLDGIGSPRRPVPDPVWGVTDPNTFGTIEFVEWCRRVGCVPYVCTNAGNGTPEEMRDWVAFCNQLSGPWAQRRVAAGHPAPLDVRYWSIGNENWGGHEIGARTPAEWGPLVDRSAGLMQEADHTLSLLAAATPDRNWTLPLLRAAGRRLDYVAIHEYWLPCWGENLTPDYTACITYSEGPEATVSRVAELLEEAGVRGRVRIAFDEWNLRGWHHPGFPRKEPVRPDDTAAAALVAARAKSDIASQYSMADALFSASFLNACLRHAPDVGMACIAPIVNTRGPLFVHREGLVKRTTFHVLAMYANLLGDCVVPTERAGTTVSSGNRTVPCLDTLATCDAQGRRWRLALINRHPSQALSCAVNLGDQPLAGDYAATVLDGDSPEAYNDVEHSERVVPKRVSLTFANGRVSLPPHSLSIVEVDI